MVLGCWVCSKVTMLIIINTPLIFFLTAFILLTSHAALMGSAILYFPDIMNTMIAKNPEFSEVIKWVMNLSATNNFVDDQILMKLFKLVRDFMNYIK